MNDKNEKQKTEQDIIDNISKLDPQDFNNLLKDNIQ